MLNILILAAGAPMADLAGGSYPVCLADFGGAPLIERIVRNCAVLKPDRMHFALRHEEVQRFNLRDVVNVLAPGASIVAIRSETGGAACTALLVAATLPADSELLILNATDLIDVDYGDVLTAWRNRRLDAGAVTFPSIHPRYSYILLDEEGLALEAAEKRPISNHASAGYFWFRSAGDFVEGAKAMIRKSAEVGGSYFVCPVFNEMILQQKRIGVYSIATQQYHPFKAERHLRDYEGLLERERLLPNERRG